jgi:ribosome-associated protein
MDIRQLQRAIVKGLEDVKAQNIVVLDTEHLSPFFERVIVASGTSNRQTKALAASVRDTVKTDGWPIPRMEGAENGEWIIVDCGPAVVHVMQPLIRDYYRLEEIWGDKPIALHELVEVTVGPKTSRTAPKKTAAAKKSASSSRAKPPADSDGAAPPRTTTATRKKAASSSGTSAKPAAKTRSASASGLEPSATGSRARKKALPSPIEKPAAGTRTRKKPSAA